MNKIKSSVPVILVISAHDPSGGAGMQADIETIRAHNCLAISVITALTEQSPLQGVRKVIPQAPEDFTNQLELLITEYNISAVKIGAIGSIDIAACILKILPRLASLPIILDPVLAATTGKTFTDQNTIELIRNEILPYCEIITPNLNEFYTLGASDTLQTALQNIYNIGCDNILITTSKTDKEYVYHQLYQKNVELIEFRSNKLAGEFHGSGCTLSASISAMLAQGKSISDSVNQSIVFTASTLKNSLVKSHNLSLPNRFPNDAK